MFHDANQRRSSQSGPAISEESPANADEIPSSDRTHVQRVLGQHFLFSGMSDVDVCRVVNSMTRVTFQKGDVLIEEGGVGDFFYAVENGSLEVTQKALPGVVDVLVQDRVFGELALIYDCPRAATVWAREESTLWALSSKVFRSLATKFMNENLQRRVAKLREIPAFANMSDDQLRRVSAVMQEERFAPGTQICCQGEILVPGLNDKFYTIAEGKVMVTSTGLPRRSSRQVVTEENQPTPSSSSSSAAAAAAATTVANGGNSFTQSTPIGKGSPPGDTSANYTLIGSPPTQHCTLISVASAASITSMQIGKRRQSYSSDTPSENGNNRLVSLGNLGPGEWFGEIALMSDAPRSANVIALGNLGGSTSNETVCFTLSRGAFEQILFSTAAQIAISGASEARKADNHEIKMRHQKTESAQALMLDGLILGEIIGEGGFSIVRVATDPHTEEIFALKTMNKADLWQRKQAVHVKNERRILMEMSHPFILNLIKTFQDDRHLYMVMEFMQGGELFSRVLKSGGGLPMYDAQFYAACVVEGLDYLHRKNIAYRDLKLENLVIGTDGYLKIIDFGFAKQVNQGMMTGTLCGTPDYLAPEAVTRVGHNHLVDCWGFGVLLYEMLTQFSPFADPTCSGNRMLVFQNIMRGVKHVDWNELARPFRTTLDRMSAKGTLDQATIRKVNEHFDHVQDLLYRVLDPNPLTRASTKTIKTHPYFASWNWATLRELAVSPPWLPQVSNDSDLRYFDVDAFKNHRETDTQYDGPVDLFDEFGSD